MEKIILLLISILPVIIIGFLIYKMDKKEREPKKELIKAFIFGILSVIITLIISFIFKIVEFDPESASISEIFIYSFFSIALVEEFSKWLLGYIFLKSNKEYDYLFDGIVYYIYVALGFACVENILYTMGSGIATGLIRAVSTVPAHAFFASTCGYYYSLHKYEKYRSNNKKSNSYLLLSLFIPILLHGFYDFCLFSRNYILLITYIVFVVSLYSFSIRNIKKLQKDDKPLKSDE